MPLVPWAATRHRNEPRRGEVRPARIAGRTRHAGAAAPHARAAGPGLLLAEERQELLRKHRRPLVGEEIPAPFTTRPGQPPRRAVLSSAFQRPAVSQHARDGRPRSAVTSAWHEKARALQRLGAAPQRARPGCPGRRDRGPVCRDGARLRRVHPRRRGAPADYLALVLGKRGEPIAGQGPTGQLEVAPFDSTTRNNRVPGQAPREKLARRTRQL